MNVSSVVVKTVPDRMNDVMENIRAVDGCEPSFHDEEGRIVVTIEGETISQEMERLKTIQALPHVLSAELAYAYSEEELRGLRDHIQGRDDAVPEALKD